MTNNNRIELLYCKHRKIKQAIEIEPTKINFIDLTILLKGNFTYRLNGKTIVLQAGDAVFIPNGYFRTRQAGDGPFDYISFNFYSSEECNFPLKIENCVHNDVLLIIALIDEITAAANGEYNAQIETLLNCLLIQIKTHLENNICNPLTKKIRNYLRDNIGQKITLADIGRLVSFSPVYCDSVFKNETGKSIIDYFLDERLSVAKGLMYESNYGLKEIAEKVGFADYNYFSRIFKKRIGYTPTQFKKLYFSVK